MNPELYERYLAKKAKKLGISVEELKAQTSSPVSSSTEETPKIEPAESKYVQQTIQGQIGQTTESKPEITGGPIHIYSPLIMEKREPSPSVTPIKDNRENKFALIGYPLGHSLSKVIHEAGFKSMGVNATYDILETPPDSLVDRIKFLKNNGYKGFNVTIPLKLPVSLFVNEVDKYADMARAINTVYINEDKTLVGYNTDVIGFKNAIPSDVDLRGKHIGILGTGGAAHAACTALSECGVNAIDFFTRSIPNSIELMNYVRRIFPSIEFNVYQIENIRNLGEYDMLVNTTPIGMLGKAGDMTPVEEDALRTLKQGAVVYDVIYNPKKTVLIKLAEKLGYRTITGLDMLIHQAVSAQQIWLGSVPDFKDMKISALEAL